jgi:hypothetical protein
MQLILFSIQSRTSGHHFSRARLRNGGVPGGRGRRGPGAGDALAGGLRAGRGHAGGGRRRSGGRHGAAVL